MARLSMPRNSSAQFLQVAINKRRRLTRMSFDAEEDIDNFAVENIYNLTGVQNIRPRSSDLISKDIVLHNCDIQKEDCQLKDSLFYIAIAYFCGLAAFGRFSQALCYNSNSAFVIAYIVMVVFSAYPIAFLDITLGQYTSKEALLAFDYCPLFEGIGYSMIMFCLIEPFPIVMNIAYSIFYMFLTLSPKFPWVNCQVIHEALSVMNTTGCSETPTPTTDIPVVYFWKLYMQSEDMRNIHMDKSKWYWMFVLSQIVAWLIVSYTLYKGRRSAYKVIRVTILPSICIVLLFFAVSIRTINTSTHFSVFWIPDYKQFLNIKMWTYATIQAFSSTGASSGIVLTLGAYYDFRNKFVSKHLILIIFVSVIIHILMGLFFLINVESITEKYKANFHNIFPKGMNLLFIVFPEKLKHWIFPQFFLIIFYFAFSLLQLIPVIVLLETFKLNIFSKIPYVAEQKTFWTFIICSMYLLVTLLNSSGSAAGFVTDYMLSNINGIALMYIGVFELTSICVFYGAKRFCTDVKFMRNSRPPSILRFVWCLNILLLTPNTVLMILMQLRNFTRRFGLGYLMAIIILICLLIPIPVFMVLNTYKFFRKHNLAGVTKPRPTAGPKRGIYKIMRESFDGIGYHK